MKENGGAEITYTCDTALFTKCISISDANFSHTLYELKEYGKAVKVVNGFNTHVAVHPYKLLIDARSTTNPKRDYRDIIEAIKAIPKYVEESNVQYTLLRDEDSPIPADIFWYR